MIKNVQMELTFEQTLPLSLSVARVIRIHRKKDNQLGKKKVKKTLRKKLFLLLRRAYLGMKGYYLPMAL